MTIVYTSQFKRDFKKLQKQNKDIAKLKSLIEKLLDSPPLRPEYRDHPLISNYTGYRECHIAPDWLLIYKKTSDKLILVRTGSHSDLFK